MTRISSSTGVASAVAAAQRAGAPSPVRMLEDTRGTYTPKQMREATNEVNQREYLAFGHLAGDATPAGLARLAKAYLNFYDQLSPDEKASARYKGTDVGARDLLQQAEGAAQSRGSADDAGNAKTKDALSVLLEAFRVRLQPMDQRREDGTSSRHTETVLLSAKALELSKEAPEVSPFVSEIAKRYSL